MLGTFNTFCVTFDTVYVKKKKKLIDYLKKKMMKNILHFKMQTKCVVPELCVKI